MKIKLKKFNFWDYIRFLLLTLNKNYSGEFSQSFFGYLVNRIKYFIKGQKNYVNAVLVDGEFAGSVGLYDIKNKTSEIGYFILKDFRKKGIATKATKKVLDFGFKKLKLNKITAITDTGNKTSQKVLKKLGFKKIKENKKEKELLWEKKK